MAGLNVSGQTSMEEIQRKRALAQMLMQGAMSPQQMGPNSSILQALMPLAQAFAAKGMLGKADTEAQTLRGERQGELARILTAGQGTPEIPGVAGMTPLTPMDDEGNPNTVIAPTAAVPAKPGGSEALARAMVGSTIPEYQQAGITMLGKADDSRQAEQRRKQELELASTLRKDERSESDKRQIEARADAAKMQADLQKQLAQMNIEGRKEVADQKAKNTNLSPTAQKELFEADDSVVSSQNAIGMLQRGLELNDKAYSGPFAKQRAQGVSLLPGESKGANASIDLDNLMTGQALETLRATFGGMPTEGERKILLEMQASLDKTPAQRKEILNRAIELAQRREQVNQEKAKALRGGTYFKESPVPAGPAGAPNVDDLLRKYGG